MQRTATKERAASHVRIEQALRPSLRGRNGRVEIHRRIQTR